MGVHREVGSDDLLQTINRPLCLGKCARTGDQDGEIADLPIALCEVQGYVYDAWLKAAMLGRALKCRSLSFF